MKKSIILALGVAALTLASCSNDSYEDWTEPQSNAQEDAYTVAMTAASAGAVDLNSTTDSQVKLVSTTVNTTATVASEAIGLKLYNANKNLSYDVAADAEGNVSTADLSKYVTALYGEQESQLSIPVEVVDTITLAGGDAYIRTAETTVSVTLAKVAASNFLYIGSKRLRVNGDKTNYQGYAYLTAGTYDIKDADGAAKSTVTIAADGFYQIDVNASDFTATATQVTKIGLIGSFNKWGGDAEMTYDKATDSFVAKDVTFTDDNTSFKIRMNGEWTTSWGGRNDINDYGDLTASQGKNLALGAGTYDFTFKLNYEGTNTLTFVKK